MADELVPITDEQAGDQIDINQKMRFDDFARLVGATLDELDVSLKNLSRLDCVPRPDYAGVVISHRDGVTALAVAGRMLMMAVSD